VSELGRGFTTALHTSIDGHGEKWFKKSPPNKQFIPHTPFISLVGQQANERTQKLFFRIHHSRKSQNYIFYGFTSTTELEKRSGNILSLKINPRKIHTRIRM
jgi:hypothetical protein